MSKHFGYFVHFSWEIPERKHTGDPRRHKTANAVILRSATCAPPCECETLCHTSSSLYVVTVVGLWLGLWRMGFWVLGPWVIRYRQCLRRHCVKQEVRAGTWSMGFLRFLNATFYIFDWGRRHRRTQAAGNACSSLMQIPKPHTRGHCMNYLHHACDLA